jgi:hypothetical protein
MEDQIKHSDRAAIDIGIAALNAFALLNGGAIVALLAFVGQVTSSGKGADIVAIIHAGQPFGYGIIASGVCFIAAYLYQSSVTATVIKGRKSCWVVAEEFFKYVMIISGLLSITFFVFGVSAVSGAFLNFSAMLATRPA